MKIEDGGNMPGNRMYEEIRIRCGNVWFLFFWKYEAGVGAFLCKKESGRLSKIDGKMALWGKEGGIIIGLGEA